MEARTLSEIIRVLRAWGMKGALVYEENGKIIFGTMDPEKVAMMRLVIDSNVANRSNIEVSNKAYINLEKINKALMTMKGKDISLEITPEKTYLRTDIQEIELNNFGMADAPTLYNREIKFKAHVIAPFEDIHMFLKAANDSAEYMTVKITPYELILHSTNEDYVETELDLPSDMLYELDADKEYKSKYSTSWAWDFAKRIEAERIRIDIGDDFPMRMSANMDGYYAEIIVAPVIESNS